MQYCVGFEKNGFEWDEKEVNFQADSLLNTSRQTR